MASYARAASALFLSIVATTSVESALVHDPGTWKNHITPLPNALSDMSATVLSGFPTENSPTRIVLAGGCDSEFGNELVLDEEYGDYFACMSITDAVYSFDPDKEATSTGENDPVHDAFQRLDDMPRKRNRHAAVAVNNKLYLLGGRNETDGLIGVIDVYDPALNSWTTPATIPEKYMTSDLGAFADKDGEFIYIVGGYEADYTAKPQTIAYSIADQTFTVKANMATDRGDVHAVTTTDGKFAYVTGGFYHHNEWCAPHQSVEKYDIENDVWTTVAPLQEGRGDKALVELNGRFFAIGGETKLDEVCGAGESELPHIGDQSVAVDDVEMYDPSLGDDAKWVSVASLISYRFRFNAAAWDKTDKIYTFGGQEGYDVDCTCFRTTAAVTSYLDQTPQGDTSTATTTSAISSLLFVLSGVAAASAWWVW